MLQPTFPCHFWYSTHQHFIGWCMTLYGFLYSTGQAVNWQHTLSLSYSQWVIKVLFSFKLERLRFSLKDSLWNFDRTWNPLLSITDITSEEPDIWVLEHCVLFNYLFSSPSLFVYYCPVFFGGFNIFIDFLFLLWGVGGGGVKRWVDRRGVDGGWAVVGGEGMLKNTKLKLWAF